MFGGLLAVFITFWYVMMILWVMPSGCNGHLDMDGGQCPFDSLIELRTCFLHFINIGVYFASDGLFSLSMELF